MTKSLLRMPLGIALVAAIGVYSASAIAQTEYFFSGDACIPGGDEGTDIMLRNSRGLSNVSADDDTYFWSYCPGGGWEDTTTEIDAHVVRFEDNDGNHSLKCQFQARDEDGNADSTSFKYGCDTDTGTNPNGCGTDSNPGFMGLGQLQWSGGEVVWNGGVDDSVVLTAKCLLYGPKSAGTGTEGTIYLYGYKTTFVDP